MASSQMTKPTVDDLSVLGVAGLVLAAGKGTRMKSSLPKVLHPVAGRPMLDWTLTTLARIGTKSVGVVVSDDQPNLLSFLNQRKELCVAVQRNRQGTGDAVAAATTLFAGVKPPPYAAGHKVQGSPITCDYILIMAGDVPAVQSESLLDFVRDAREHSADLAVLGMRVPKPRGYGRMVTRGSELLAIVEEKDADAATRSIDLCNTGIIFARVDVVFAALQLLTPNNAQNEYYLTDCVQHARTLGFRVCAHEAADWQEFGGVNDRAQLADAESWLMARKRRELMLSGVTLRLSDSIYIEEDVVIGADSIIESGCHLSGRTKVGSGCVIGAGSVLKNTVVASGERVPPLSVLIS